MVKVDADNLLVDKADLDQAKADFDELVARIGSIIGRIPESWEGQAAVAYSDQFDEVKSQALTPVSELLETISAQIQQVCDNVDEFDNNIANQLR